MTELHREPLEDSVANCEDEYQKMLLSLALYRPRASVYNAIQSAYTDPEWDWTKCDGCSFVSEMHFPPGFRFPACVMHDWYYQRVRDGKTKRRFADKMFRYAMIDYGVNPARAWIRWAGVRLGGWKAVR